MAHSTHSSGPAHHHEEEIGRDGQPHGHHVMSAGALLAILIILLSLTGLTVYTAKEWHLGLLGNASLAIVIATIKCTLVCMYFMHLRYDNHFYTVALLSCVLAVVLFIGMSMKDLGTRDAIDPQRAMLLSPVPEDKVTLGRFNEIERNGRKVYLASCASCHGATGEGIPQPDAFYGDSRARLGPTLVKSAFVRRLSDAELAKFITEGREKNHPDSIWGASHLPKGGSPGMTDEQVAQVVQFLRKISAEPKHGGH